MGKRNTEVKFRCIDDCCVNGCPEHTLTGCYSTTTNYMCFRDEKENVIFEGDCNKLTALLKAIKKVDLIREPFLD